MAKETTKEEILRKSGIEPKPKKLPKIPPKKNEKQNPKKKSK
jgi:hypothetical protein